MCSDVLPKIIQGGMGVGISGWRLAKAVSSVGQLGVVSGTVLDAILARRLQHGDSRGHLRRALEHFPLPKVAHQILERFFVPGGKRPGDRYRPAPMSSFPMSQKLTELTVVGNFVEVFLAREGHSGEVGINYLEKIQLPILPALYGAMLAGVSWVLMGAGIPRSVPGTLDRLAKGEPVELKLEVQGASEPHAMRFDPAKFMGGTPPRLSRPKFLAIVSSETLATMLAKKSNGYVDGFIVEEHSAGGHNAPPRGKAQFNNAGEPIYGKRDVANLEAMRKLGRPFWLAGSFATPSRLAEARREGAAGVQIGTAFAYCEESDLDDEIKRRVLAASQTGDVSVLTGGRTSPTGFPFKVVQLDETLSQEEVYQQRTRVCDLGYLRQAYQREDGTIGWRCASEPVADYVRKGGEECETEGRKCLCNALLANIGLGQIQPSGNQEGKLITSGDEVAKVARYLKPGASSYTARDVLEYMLAGDVSPTPSPIRPLSQKLESVPV